MDQDEKVGREFANAFSKFVNNFNREDKQFAVEAMLRDHPTLQQSMMRFFMQFVAGMAGQARVDGRNEASVKLAKRIVELDGTGLPMI